MWIPEYTSHSQHFRIAMQSVNCLAKTGLHDCIKDFTGIRNSKYNGYKIVAHDSGNLPDSEISF